MKETKDILAINLASAAKDLFKNWQVLAISIFVMMLLAFIYLRYAARTYKIEASVLLRIEKQNAHYSGNNDIFRAFDFMVQDRSFNNELFYLRSLPLIQEVVSELELRTSYYAQDKIIPRFIKNFGKHNIYKNSPILVIPDEDNLQPIDMLFEVEIIDESQFRISASGKNVGMLNLKTEGVESYAPSVSFSGTYVFGAAIKNPHGAFRVFLNPNYSPESFNRKKIFFKFNNLNYLALGFQSNMTVEGIGVESTLAQLVVKADNSSLGLDFMDKLIDAYIQNTLDEANILANKTIEHIERQLEDVTDDLSQSERQLQNLRVNRNVMNIDDKSQNIYQQLQALDVRLGEANRRYSQLSQLSDYFTQFKDSTKILAPSALGLADPVLNTLITELTALNSEKQRIVSQDQMRNPRLGTINVRIDNLKGLISENISFSLTSTRNELSEINTRINALNRDFSILPGTQRELLDIERRFKLNDAIYTSLLERRIQAQIVKASKLPDAKIVEPPRYSGVASPLAVLVYALSFFIGFMIPGGYVIGKKFIFDRLSSLDELKIITNVPVIAHIPTCSSDVKSITEAPNSIMAEAFYMLRSNLGYYLHGEKNKVILITSSIAGEGKSFSSYNIAASFALSNSKTIFVEFDLRKPSAVLHGVNSHDVKGLSSYLINKAQLQDVIIKTELANLDVIQSGTIPPNPIALISSQRTQELLEELRSQYDYVIVDTPPYGLLTDSFMLMAHADLIIYLTRMNFTKKGLFANNIEDLEKKSVNNLYLLINEDNDKSRSYGYRKYYTKKERGIAVKAKQLT